MDFALSDQNRLLEESVQRYLEREYGFEDRRALAASELGFSRRHWARYAELGWLGIPFSAEDGGYGGSALDMMVLMEAFGSHLVLEPYLATVLLGGELLRVGANPAQREMRIPAIVSGDLMLSLAHSEPGARFELSRVSTRARPANGEFVLSGHKSVVSHAASADELIVSARTAGADHDPRGITLFIIPRDAEGLSLRGYPTVDGLRAAEVMFDDVRVGPEAVLGEVDDGLPIVERAVEHAIAALCAEAVGAMHALVESTRDYLSTRSQFGVTLDQFQVLQHRAVDMFMAEELSRSTSFAAAHALELDDALARRRTVSSAKVQIGQAGRFVGQQAIQLHGGVGMTDELPIGHYFKRLSMIDAAFGNAEHHLQRLCAM